MAEPFTDDRLALVLASVGEHLVVPDVDVVPAPGDRGLRRSPGARTARRRVVAAAIAAGVGLGVGAGVAPVREAVADWFGLGSTGFERVAPEDADAADPHGLPPLDAGLHSVSESAAESVLGRPLPSFAGTTLGEPDRIVLPPESGVLLVWEKDATSLWIKSNEDPAYVLVDKLLDSYDTVEPLDDLGEGAVFVEGDHVLATPYRRVAAGTVVLWVDDGLELRLESDRPVDDLVTTAWAIDAVMDATGDQRRSPGS
jgi:hypothetical protein